MDKLIKLGQAPKGVNQKAQETSLPEGTLREAVNVILDDAGKPKRRPGYTKLLDLSNAHSLWANDHQIVFASGGSLWITNPEMTLTSELLSDVGSEPFSYTVAADWLYYTNGRVNGRVNLMATSRFEPRWGPPATDGNPVLSAGVGNLQPGQYQVTVSFVDSTGAESGAEAPAVITLNAAGGIHLSSIPQGDAESIRIYCSLTNDTQLYRQASVPMGTTEYSITQLRRGKVCNTLFLEPLPLGHIVRHYRGRTYVAKDNAVYYSLPISYGLYEPDHGYIAPFPTRITMMEPVLDGLYISADKTYFLSGNNPDEFSLQIADHGVAVPGSSMVLNAQYVIPEYVGELAYWYDRDGPVIGVNGGMIQHLALDAIVGSSATRAASGILRDNGVDRVVTSLAGAAEFSGFRAGDSSTLEIIRSS